MSIKANGVSYTTTDIVGRGSFGVVFRAICDTDNTTVAIKKVLQDRRFKVKQQNRFTSIFRENVDLFKTESRIANTSRIKSFKYCFSKG